MQTADTGPLSNWEAEPELHVLHPPLLLTATPPLTVLSLISGCQSSTHLALN